MNILIGSEYRLTRPKTGGWSLDRWDEGGKEYTVRAGEDKGKKAVSGAGWKSMGKYPHDLRHALQIISEDYIDRTSGTLDIKDALKAVSEYIKALDIKAEGVEM